MSPHLSVSLRGWVRSAPRALAGLLLASLMGCSPAADLEEGELDGKPECSDAACHLACSKNVDCELGYRCVEGVCQADVESDPSSGDSGVQAGLDAGDVGFDAGDTDGGQPEAECAEGSVRCDTSADVLRSVCRNGTWQVESPCQSGALCDSADGQCKPVAPVCLGRTPHATFCEGSVRFVCGPDLVTVTQQQCESNAHCREGQGEQCATCLPGASTCEGDALARCDETGQRFEHVEGCKPGECNAELGRCTAQLCQPNAYSCADNVLHKCNHDGTAYAETEDCAGGVCDAAQGECDVCVANEVQGCADKATQNVCSSDGRRVEARSCASLDASKPVCSGNGVCTTCDPLTSVCQSPSSLLSCNAQGEPSLTACPTDRTCSDGACTGECGPGQLRCVGAASADRQSCGPDGTYVAGELCPEDTLCNRAAATSGDCSPILTGCAEKSPGDAVCNGRQRIVCGPDLVTMASSQACKSAAHCQQGSGADCAVCLEGEFACEGAQLQICNAERTGFVNHGSPCASAELCNRELGQCTSVICQANAWSCNGDTLRHCNAEGTDYIVSDMQPCGPGLCNANGQRCDTCIPGAIRCVEEGGTGRVQCNADGRSESPIAACSNACLAGNCVDCAPGATRCDPSRPQQYRQLCNDAGAWEAATDCSESGQTCLYEAATGTSACGGECAAGIPRCTASGDSQDCSTTGTLMAPVVCDAASQICKKQTGLCAANPILNLGRHLAADGTSTRALASRILATPIRTTDAVRLLELGVLTSDQSSGGFAMMAIYRDTVVSNLHRPGALIAYTIETGLWSNTANTIAPEDTTVVLEANTTYWLAVVQDGASVYYRQYTATPSADGTGVYVEASYSWPDNFPATFPSPAYMSGFELSVFARVHRIWQH